MPVSKVNFFSPKACQGNIQRLHEVSLTRKKSRSTYICLACIWWNEMKKIWGKLKNFKHLYGWHVRIRCIYKTEIWLSNLWWIFYKLEESKKSYQKIFWKYSININRQRGVPKMSAIYVAQIADSMNPTGRLR